MFQSPYNRPPGYPHFFDTQTPPPGFGGNFHRQPPARHNQTAFQPDARPRTSANPKAHARRASQQYAGFSPRHPPPGNYPTSSPLREHVSSAFEFEYHWGQTRTPRAPKEDFPYWRDEKQPRTSRQPPPPYSNSNWDRNFNAVPDEEDIRYRDPPPPYQARSRPSRYHFAGADPYSFYQERSHPAPTPQPEPMTPKANQSRPRRASHVPRPQPSPKPKPSPSAKSRPATAEDALRSGIPAGYSLKNWDPAEEPIVLLGSVFDANSLGKWIYDWTVYSYGPNTPMADVAGDLWLLLIQLAGKNKRADEAIDKIRQEEKRELVEDFLESGERLWVRFKKLLKICEEFMWKAAQRETGDKRPAAMGKNSGCEFVDSIFGRDRELDKTEKLMSNIRLWSMRFDANCDEILRNPAA